MGETLRKRRKRFVRGEHSVTVGKLFTSFPLSKLFPRLAVCCAAWGGVHISIYRYNPPIRDCIEVVVLQTRTRRLSRGSRDIQEVTLRNQGKSLRGRNAPYTGGEICEGATFSNGGKTLRAICCAACASPSMVTTHPFGTASGTSRGCCRA